VERGAGIVGTTVQGCRLCSVHSTGHRHTQQAPPATGGSLENREKTSSKVKTSDSKGCGGVVSRGQY
jgi:hypothetical protein